jgi:hypothetical protein
MRKLWFAIAICGLFCMPLFAEEYPTAVVYGGYQVHVPNLGDSMHGLYAGAEYNFSPVMGLAGEFGYGKKTTNTIGYSLVNKDYSYMVGPRFSYRSGKARAFAHVMLGGVTEKAKFSSVTMGIGSSANKDTNFQLAFGGGLEVKISSRVFFRPAQFELLEKYNTVPGSGKATWDSGLRYSTGLVIEFGSKGK